jgi:hypothetical protein
MRYAVTSSGQLLCGILVPRMSQLPTNPILAAPANARIACVADRRISAGFIVEAAPGTSVLRRVSSVTLYTEQRSKHRRS